MNRSHLQRVYVESALDGIGFEGWEFKSSLNSFRVFVIFTREYADNDSAYDKGQGFWVDTENVDTYRYI